MVHPTCEGARRVAIHGLSAAGNAVVPGLLDLLRSSDASNEFGLRAMTYVVDALGEAAEDQKSWSTALQLLGEKQVLLNAAIQTGHGKVAAVGGTRLRAPWHSPSPISAVKSVLHAVEHIAQRAVAACDAPAAQLACAILTKALTGPAASVAAGVAASVTVADIAFLGDQGSALLTQLRTNATNSDTDYRERALATEALRRLVAPRGRSVLASAQRCVTQSLLEVQWAPPEEDPRQNGQIAGVKRPQEVAQVA